MKNPVLRHGASSKEKASWPFISALPSGAFWLFHVKVVIDTNVFVSCVFFTGPPYHIVEAWRNAKIGIVISQDIFEEYRRMGEGLANRFPGTDIGPILELLMLNAEIVSSESRPDPICTDSDDDKFLSCALRSGAKLVISGHKHLLKASGYKGLRIIRPRRFVDDYL